uniref:Breast cancer metastasis-suppressor 1-like protein-A n=1 Tax=Scophthalmus maximus TaxID=52904 RepID=A0A8D3AHI5_SCOMX
MPVHRDREKKESTAEEMEVEEHEQEASSTEEEDSDTSSVSDDGDSSEMDEEDCERRRIECLDEMSNLEKQFTDLKDQLYRERLSQVNSKLQEVEAGRAAEYLEPLAVLLENMQVRTKVAGIYRELCLESVKNKYQCEIQAACQHWESEKLLLFDTVQSELEEKIRRLEEDRHSIDITSELWNDELSGRKKRRDALSPDKKKRRPSVVSDIPSLLIPLLLIRLILLQSDWTAIRKAVATLGPHRGKTDADSPWNSPLTPHFLDIEITGKYLHLSSIDSAQAFWKGFPSRGYLNQDVKFMTRLHIMALRFFVSNIAGY